MVEGVLVYYESSQTMRGGWRLVYPDKLKMIIGYTKEVWKYLDVVDRYK